MKTLKKTTTAVFSILLTLTIISCLRVPTFAAKTYGDLSYTIENAKVTITDCSEMAISIKIPEKILNYPVTSIGKYAFYDCSMLTSITIPNSVISIGEYAFCGCSLLKSITIPNSVTTIGEYAFQDCSLLTSITIPDSVTSIREDTFFRCINLQNVKLSRNLISIGKEAFYRTAINTLIVPKSVKLIGEWALIHDNYPQVINVQYEGTREEWNAIALGAHNDIRVYYGYCYHIEETIPGRNATCIRTGLTEGIKCSVCGKILKEQEVTPIISHKAEPIKGKMATCTETGLTDGSICSVCGKILKEQEVTPMISHKAEPVKGKMATCTETGLTDGSICSVCGTVITAQTTIPAKGHSGNWTIVTKATMDAEGLEKRTCTICGVEETRIIPKLYTKGDLNKDGKITAADARLALRISAKLETATDEMTVIADVNDDKKITAADARMILRVSAKLDSF